MILVADGGSTKTSWCLIDEIGENRTFKTEGYNPFFMDEASILASLIKSIPGYVDVDRVAVIHFYGADVHSPAKALVLKHAFTRVFKNAGIHIEHDLLAAARATLGDTAGFVSILGTGTNSCLFDGETIIQNIESGGYIIGDEGSGTHIGKQLLSDYLRGYLPKALQDKFTLKYNATAAEILERIYTQPLANRYLASYCEFIGEHIHHEYCYNLVHASFTDLFENLVSHYPGYKTYTFNCIGSVGYNFRSILEETARDFGMKTGSIISSPMQGLVSYHSAHSLKLNSSITQNIT